MISTGYLYAQSDEDVSTNEDFFSYLSDKICESRVVSHSSVISLKTELPTAFAQQLRAALLKKKITVSSSAENHLILNFSTANIYEKNRNDTIKRLLSGTAEVLTENSNGTVKDQVLIDYSYSDTISEEDVNRLSNNELTKPDQIREAPEGFWQKIGIPAVILSGIGTATMLLFYVRG